MTYSSDTPLLYHSLDERIVVFQAKLLNDICLGDKHPGEVARYVDNARPLASLNLAIGQASGAMPASGLAQVSEASLYQVVLSVVAGSGCATVHSQPVQWTVPAPAGNEVESEARVYGVGAETTTCRSDTVVRAHD